MTLTFPTLESTFCFLSYDFIEPVSNYKFSTDSFLKYITDTSEP